MQEQRATVNQEIMKQARDNLSILDHARIDELIKAHDEWFEIDLPIPDGRDAKIDRILDIGPDAADPFVLFAFLIEQGVLETM
jgi:hypothetical protein